MKKQNIVIEGISKLPPGFRFQPTDEEVLFEYLRCKLFSLPLPASVIPELHFSNLDPPHLPGDSMEERYVFTKKAKYKNNSSSNQFKRATRSGYWETIIGSEKHFIPPPTRNIGMMKIIKGIKTTFVFHSGKSPSSRSRPTDWFMHEYSLTLNNNNYKNTCKMEDWVICHIFYKQKQGMEEEEDDEGIMVDYSSDGYHLSATSSKFNEMVLFNQHSCPCSSSSSSSSSSSITEVCSNESLSDEESSYFL